MSLNVSKLNVEKIQEIIKKEYNIDFQNILKIPGGSANLYRIFDVNNNQYVLKEFQNGFDIDDVIFEKVYSYRFRERKL